MITNVFESGTTIRLECVITTDCGVPYNPATLTFTMLIPGATSPTVVTYTTPEPDGIGVLHYCNDGNNLNITGTYYIDWLTTVAGQYKFLFNASGDLSITQRGSFTVQKLF